MARAGVGGGGAIYTLRFSQSYLLKMFYPVRDIH